MVRKMRVFRIKILKQELLQWRRERVGIQKVPVGAGYHADVAAAAVEVVVAKDHIVEEAGTAVRPAAGGMLAVGD